MKKSKSSEHDVCDGGLGVTTENRRAVEVHNGPKIAAGDKRKEPRK